MNCHIDDVIKDDEGMLIRGFVVSDYPVSFSVINPHSNKEYEISVIRFKYKNVMVEYKEAEAAPEAGFFVRVNEFKRGLSLEIKSNGKTCSLPIILEHDYSKKNSQTYLNYLTINYNKLKKSLKRRGVVGTIGKAFSKVFFPDRTYEKYLASITLSKEEIERQKQESFGYEPKFSIVVPLYETADNFLRELVDSIKSQTYSNWEICFSDGSKDCTRLSLLIEEMSAKDNRIRYIASDRGPLGISANTNQAISIATGDYIVLGDHDDLFTVDALYECVKSLNEIRSDIIYTDEDKTDVETKKFFEPHFKPDFNIGFFRSNNYICHMFVVKKEIADIAGPFKEEYNGAQDYDYILRCTENAKVITHIPKVLYHWRFHMESTAAIPESKLYAYEAGKNAVEAHYKRLGIDATVSLGKDYGYYDSRFPVKNESKVSEITIKNNMSIKDINFLANSSDGEYLLFIDEKVKPQNSDYKERMLEFAQFEDVGAVGARIFYEDETICHAGMILGMYGSAGRIFEGQKEIDVYHGKSRYACDYSGVSAMCMMTKKNDFLSVDGFDESYTSNYFDMDYCLKLRQKGLRVCYQPKSTLLFTDKKLKKNSENKNDKEYFINKWKAEITKGDPYFNKNLSLTNPNYVARVN